MYMKYEYEIGAALCSWLLYLAVVVCVSNALTGFFHHLSIYITTTNKDTKEKRSHTHTHTK